MYKASVNYNKEKKQVTQRIKQSRYKRGVTKVHARSFHLLYPEFLVY